MHASQPQWQADDALRALACVFRLHRIAFDARLVSAALPDRVDIDAWCEVAGRAGLTTFPIAPADAHPDRLARAITAAGARCAVGVPLGADARGAYVVVVDADGTLGAMVAVADASPDLPTAAPATDRGAPPDRLTPDAFAWIAIALADVVAAAHDDPAPTRPFGFRWFVPELLRHRRTWRDVVLASLLLQLFALATPVLTQVVIDKVVVHHTVDTLWVVVTALAGATLFGAVLGWLRQAFVTHAGTRIDAMLGDRVFRHLLGLPLRWFEQRATGQIVARLQGVETVRDFLTGAAVGLVLDVPFALLFIVVMASYSGTLTAVALGGLVLVAVASALGLPVVRARLEQQMRSAARNQAFVTEAVAAAATLKSLQLEPLTARRFGALLADSLTCAWRTRQAFNGWQVTAQALEQATHVAILAAGAWAVMHDPGFTVGMLVAFQMFASRLAQPVMRLVGLWQELQQAALAVHRLADVMDATPEPVTVRPTLAVDRAVAVAFTGVRFRYGPQRPLVLDGFDLVLAPGTCTALTGPSGSGKSTIARLLQGFEFCEAGRVEVAGRDTRTLAANELRALLGVVPQDTVLFARSVWDNLVDAAPDADLARVVRACRIAEVHDVIEQLPQGYQTVLGERGIGLSGGQRQRIAIARALLRRPAVLVFDEATSALDADTAAAFARTVNRLRGRVTMLFIAHHLPADLIVDRVVPLPGPQRPKVAALRPDPAATDADFAPRHAMP